MSQRVKFSFRNPTRQDNANIPILDSWNNMPACLPNNFCFMTLFYVLPQVHRAPLNKNTAKHLFLLFIGSPNDSKPSPANKTDMGIVRVPQTQLYDLFAQFHPNYAFMNFQKNF